MLALILHKLQQLNFNNIKCVYLTGLTAVYVYLILNFVAHYEEDN